MLSFRNEWNGSLAQGSLGEIRKASTYLSVRFASSLAAALLDGLSEQPAMASERVCQCQGLAFLVMLK